MGTSHHSKHHWDYDQRITIYIVIAELKLAEIFNPAISTKCGHKKARK